MENSNQTNKPICTVFTTNSLLLKNLKVAAPLAKQNSIFAIGDHFLVEFSEKKWKVTSTNINDTIIIEDELDGILGTVKTCIPAKPIIDLLSALPAETAVYLDFTINSLLITTAEQRYKFHLEDANQFMLPPGEVQVIGNFEMETELMQKVIGLRYAISKDESRPQNWKSVLFDFKMVGIKFCATNGFLVHEIQKKQDEIKINPMQVLLLGSSLDTLKTLLKGEDKVNFNITFGRVEFKFGSTTYITRRIDEKFVDYKEVLFNGDGHQFTLYRLPLLAALQRINIITIHEGCLIFMFKRDSIEIIGRNEYTDMTAQEHIGIESCNYDEENELILSFSISSLIECLKNLNTPTIQFNIVSVSKLVRIKALHDDEIIENVGILPVRPLNFQL